MCICCFNYVKKVNKHTYAFIFEFYVFLNGKWGILRKNV